VRRRLLLSVLGKLATYVLPAFPALALLTARALRSDAQEEPRAARHAQTIGAVACASLFVIALAALHRQAPGLEKLALLVLPVSAAGLVAVAAGRRLTTLGAVVTCSVGALLSVLALNTFAGDAISRYTSDEDLARVAASAPPARNVIAYRVRPFSFQFYTGWRLRYHDSLDEIRKILYSPARRWS
jgi:4-amino-4-deoxy-L-arabinose transferase-like glycosyltransferase